MKAYVFQAALLCEDCAETTMQSLEKAGKPSDGWGDSENWPQGPYEDGGGEADTPQHCDHCRIFLENPLTTDGEEYVRYNSPLGIWKQFYSYLWEE